MRPRRGWGDWAAQVATKILLRTELREKGDELESPSP